MIRNLKALGLALVAALALGAMAASAASADKFAAEKEPVTLTATQTGAGDVFTTTSGEVECEKATYQGTAEESPTESITVSPTYEECFFGGVVPATIHMNGCEYNFTIGAGTTGSVHIECPPEAEITVTVTLFGTNKCTVHVPPQTIGGITYSQVGTGETTEIKVSVNATGLTYTHTSGTGFGACSGTGETLKHDGTYTGEALVTGEEDGGEGKHVGLTLIA